MECEYQVVADTRCACESGNFCESSALESNSSLRFEQWRAISRSHRRLTVIYDRVTLVVTFFLPKAEPLARCLSDEYFCIRRVLYIILERRKLYQLPQFSLRVRRADVALFSDLCRYIFLSLHTIRSLAVGQVRTRSVQ